MTKTVELAKNTAILGVGKLIGQLATFLVLPIYSFFLAPEDFGFVDLIVTYAAIVVPTLLLQLDRGVFRFIIDDHKDLKATSKVVSTALSIVFRVLVIVLAVYFLVAIFIPIPHFWLIFALIMANVLSNFLLQVARGFGRNSLYAVSSAVNGVVLFCGVAVCLIVLDMHIEGVLVAMTLGYVASAACVYSKLDILKYIDFRAIDVSTRRRLLTYSLPLIPSSMAWWVINAADRTIITMFLGIAATGIYALAFRYSSVFVALYMIFDMAWTEAASRHINAPDRDAFFRSIYNRILMLFGSLGLFFIAGIPFLSNFLISPQFSEVYQYLPILIIAALMNVIVAGYSVIYIATKNTKKVMTTSLIAAILSIILNLALLPFLGLYAPAISSIIAFGAMAVLRYFDVQKYVRFSYDRYLIFSLVPMYGLVICIYYLGSPLWNIASVVSVCIFVSVLCRNDINKIFGRLRKL